MPTINQTFTVNKTLKVTLTEENGCISGICIPVNATQRHRFLTLFNQKDITPETTCYTGLLKKGLVEYNYHQKLHPSSDKAITDAVSTITDRLEQCIAPFIELERLINNPTAASKDNFQALEKLKNCIEENFTDTTQALELDQNTTLYASLESNKKILLESIETLKKKVPDPSDLQQLFCIQDGAIDGTGEIHSLGTYIANQLILICDHSINEIYHKTGNRLYQAFFIHPAIKALSDVKSHLEIRGLSLKGACEENSLMPIPTELLDVLTFNPAEEKTSDELINLSLAPYLDHFSDVEEINRMIDILSNPKKEKFDEHPMEWSLIPIVFITNILEYIPASLHFCASIASFLGEGVCWVLNLISSSDEFGMEWLDKKATYYHHRLSPVRWCKETLKEDYLKHYEDDEKEVNLHRELLEHLWYTAAPSENANNSAVERHQASEYSTLNILCSAYSGHRMAARVGDFWRGAFRVIKTIGIKFTFVFFMNSTAADREAAFREKQEEVKQNWKTLQNEFIATLRELQSHVKEPQTTNAEESPQTEIKEHILPTKKWSVGKPWPKNESPSIFDITGEFCSVADKLIGPIFRHRPGPATLFFGLSCASLSVLLHPSLSTNSNTAWLGSVSTWLLKNFTGKAVTDGVAAKVIAIFLQWKILVLTYEAGTELAEENITFLRQLFRDLDRTTFIILVLVGGGAALQLLHDYHIELPTGLPASLANPTSSVWVNEYLQLSTKALAILPALINALADESALCSTGHFPFLEYLILGIKLGLVLQSAFSGKKDIPLFDSVKIIKAIMADPDWVKHSQKADDELANIVKNKLAIQGIIASSEEGEYQECVAAFVKAIKSSSFVDIQRSETEEIKHHVAVLSPAQQKLKEAIQLVNAMRAQGQSGFQSKKKSWLFYDGLNECFDKYNQEMRLHGLPEINKENYLNAFRIQYCDKGEVMLFRLFSIIPFYPVTLLWRGINYVVSDSAYIKDNIAHSFSKDAAMLIQFFSDLLRPLREFSRAISYVLRIALAIPLLLISSPVLLFFTVTGQSSKSREMIEDILTWTAQIRLHHFTATCFLRAKYAKLARVTNTNEESNNLVSLGKQIISHIDESQGKCTVQTETTWKQYCEALAEKRAPSANGFFGCNTATIYKAVRQLTSLFSSGLTSAEKQEKSNAVMNQLGNQNDLRMFKSIVMRGIDPIQPNSLLSSRISTVP